MTLEQIEQRCSLLLDELQKEGADTESISAEVEALESRKAEILQGIETRKAEEAEVIRTGIEVKDFNEQKGNEHMEEIRNSKAYMDAYKRYIITESDKELRALLTENAEGGNLPVPAVVYDTVKTAWEREELTALVRKVYLKSNLKVGFEISGDDAVFHAEGGEAVTPENLQTGIVTLLPVSVKKIVEISDEALDMEGEAFLRYIYDEITYRIAKAVALVLVNIIINLPTTATATQVPAQHLTGTLGLDSVAKAIATLSDEAVNPVLVMSKATWAQFKALQYSANYAVDPFEGLRVIFNSAVPAGGFIVGDFDHGALINLPNGEDIRFKFDENTKAELDLVRIIGRMYIGIGAVAPYAFATFNTGTANEV